MDREEVYERLFRYACDNEGEAQEMLQDIPEAHREAAQVGIYRAFGEEENE